MSTTSIFHEINFQNSNRPDRKVGQHPWMCLTHVKLAHVAHAPESVLFSCHHPISIPIPSMKNEKMTHISN